MEVINNDPAISPTADPISTTAQPLQDFSDTRQTAYVRIAEQPASSFRFRYKSEGNKSGSLPGINNTPELKTFPTIEIIGYEGKAVVVVSCVTKDSDDHGKYHPHPHGLVGKEGIKNGVCTIKVNVGRDNGKVVFSDLGIQCVKRKEVQSSLKARGDINVDPFNSKYACIYF